MSPTDRFFFWLRVFARGCEREELDQVPKKIAIANHTSFLFSRIAGNPDDPIKGEGESAAHGGMSAEDRRLSESVARSVMRITHDVKVWDETETVSTIGSRLSGHLIFFRGPLVFLYLPPKTRRADQSLRLQWNKALFYGDWLNDQKGFRQFYVEIQVKRISGADNVLLEKCGVSSRFAWLPLHDEEAAPVSPITVPVLYLQPEVPSQAPRELPNPHKAACEPIAETEEDEDVNLEPGLSLEVPTSSADKGKGKSEAPSQGQAAGGNPIADRPVIVSSDSVHSPQKRTRIPSIAELDRHPDYRIDGIDPPRTGIPRSQPLPATGSFNSLETPHSEAGVRADELYQEEGSIYLAEDVNPFEALIPAHQASAVSAADLHRHRAEFDRNAYNKDVELNRIFSFMDDPEFIERKNKSFVYAVRVIAIPDRGDVVNVFTGPRIESRFGTHIAQGGWIVPPLEERIRYHNDHKRAYRNKGAKPGKYDGVPRSQVQNAMPINFDWSGYLEPRYFGPLAPVWREVADPCLEDIYWMVWQLLAGKQFLGFRPGNGFGAPRDPFGDQELLHQCPFKSPSTEALYHSASYPRGKES